MKVKRRFGMEKAIQFPDVETADEYGCVGATLDVSVDYLYEAYSNGIFPWPDEEIDFVPWFAPAERAILVFDNLHIGRRLQRDLKKRDFHFSVNKRFPEVIRQCAAYHPNRQGTWISQEMIDAYTAFHEQGYGWSFETLNGQGDLVGGVYGVRIGRYFAGESMFHRETSASKFALINAVEYLRSEGSTWLDTQMMTPLLASFGATPIPRQEFMAKLAEALEA